MSVINEIDKEEANNLEKVPVAQEKDYKNMDLSISY